MSGVLGSVPRCRSSANSTSSPVSAKMRPVPKRRRCDERGADLDQAQTGLLRQLGDLSRVPADRGLVGPQFRIGLGDSVEELLEELHDKGSIRLQLAAKCLEVILD